MQDSAVALFIAHGQGLKQLAELGAALVLSTAIGLEREVRQKSAGLRTHALVGVGAALMTLVSKYGFEDVLGPHTSFDPARVAAQIVTGIGFIGGGVIFVRRDVVKGLTTAAVVWLTAGVGMACGAGLLLLAVVATAGHYLVAYGYPLVARRVPTPRYRVTPLRVEYRDGTGALRRALVVLTEEGITVGGVTIDRSALEGASTSIVTMHLTGPVSASALTAEFSEIDGIVSAEIGTEEVSE